MSTRLSTEARSELLAALHDYAILGGPHARSNGWRWADCDLLLAAEAEIRSIVSESGRTRRALRDLLAASVETQKFVPEIAARRRELLDAVDAARAVLSENREAE